VSTSIPPSAARPLEWAAPPAPRSSAPALVLVLVLVLVLALVLGGTGCARDVSTPAGDDIVRDSAGIEIVESGSPVWTEATRWRLGDEPLMELGRVGGGAPEEEFANILGVHGLSDGGVAVVDRWRALIVFFDASGAALGRAGGVGSGPGEFRSFEFMRESFACRDTVFVATLGGMAQGFVAPGAYVRTFRAEPPPEGGTPGVRLCGAGGFVVQSRHSARPVTPGLHRDSVLLTWHDRDGRMRAVIDSVPSADRMWVQGVHEGLGYSDALFGPSLSVAARDDVLVTGFADRFELAVRDGSGAVRRIVRVDGRGRTVGAEDVDRFAAFVLDPWRGNQDERRRLEERLEAALGRPVPAFADVEVDAAGNVWARDFDHLDAVAWFDHYDALGGLGISTERSELDRSRRWAVIGTDGRYLGEVLTPPRFRVHDIGEDWVLGVWRDELDVEYVRKYPLIKP